TRRSAQQASDFDRKRRGGDRQQSAPFAEHLPVCCRESFWACDEPIRLWFNSALCTHTRHLRVAFFMCELHVACCVIRYATFSVFPCFCACSQPPDRLTVYPSVWSHPMASSTRSPWMMIAQSLTLPPVPARFFSF